MEVPPQQSAVRAGTGVIRVVALLAVAAAGVAGRAAEGRPSRDARGHRGVHLRDVVRPVLRAAPRNAARNPERGRRLHRMEEADAAVGREQDRDVGRPAGHGVHDADRRADVEMDLHIRALRIACVVVRRPVHRRDGQGRVRVAVLVAPLVDDAGAVTAAQLQQRQPRRRADLDLRRAVQGRHLGGEVGRRLTCMGPDRLATLDVRTEDHGGIP